VAFKSSHERSRAAPTNACTSFQGYDLAKTLEGGVLLLLLEPHVHAQGTREQDVVRMELRDTAIVTGVDHLKGRYKSTQGEGRLRFLDVLIYRDGRWRLVATQGTWVTPPQPAPSN
jgi:hypothetical protein